MYLRGEGRNTLPPVHGWKGNRNVENILKKSNAPVKIACQRAEAAEEKVKVEATVAKEASQRKAASVVRQVTESARAGSCYSS